MCVKTQKQIIYFSVLDYMTLPADGFVEIVFGMGFISPASETAVWVTRSLPGFLMEIRMSERWILMAQWATSSSAEMIHLILFTSFVVRFEGGFSWKYKTIAVFLDFNGEQCT